MFRPDRLLVRTYSCTAVPVPVPVPVPVAGIYYCTSNCGYACMRAVQNCMLARASAPEKFYRLFQYRRSKSVPNRLKQSIYVQAREIAWTNPLVMYSVHRLNQPTCRFYNWHFRYSSTCRILPVPRRYVLLSGSDYVG